MNNLVLVPEREFSEFKNWKLRRGVSGDGGIIQAIHNPEQREMVKKYHAAQEVLNDSNKPYELRKAQYDEIMRSFHTLKDRISGIRGISNPEIGKSQEDNVNNDEKDKSIDDIVDIMPESIKSNARNLMKQIQKNGNENLISWSPTNGEVSIRGSRLAGSNIIDLVGDVMRSSTGKISKRKNLNRDAFIDALVEMNAPETLIKNRDALRHFREMKENNLLSPAAKRVKENEHRHPPGIPENILKESESEDEKDKFVKNFHLSELGNSNASPLAKMKKAIPWANTR